jgi:hypothetical protein
MELLLHTTKLFREISTFQIKSDLVDQFKAPFTYAKKNKLKYCFDWFVWEKNTVMVKKTS